MCGQQAPAEVPQVPELCQPRVTSHVWFNFNYYFSIKLCPQPPLRRWRPGREAAGPAAGQGASSPASCGCAWPSEGVKVTKRRSWSAPERHLMKMYICIKHLPRMGLGNKCQKLFKCEKIAARLSWGRSPVKSRHFSFLHK